MHALHRNVSKQLPSTKLPARLIFQYRSASLTSAISRGVRKAASALKNAENRRIRENKLAPWDRRDEEKVALADKYHRERSEWERELLSHHQTEDASNKALDPRNHQQPRAPNRPDQRERSRLKAQGIAIDAPAAVPYTTADVDFVYGTFGVLAALKADRRKFYNLYIWAGDDTKPVDADHQAIVKTAKANGVPTKRVGGSWASMLDRMADGRPHNGFVLEASRIIPVPVSTLLEVGDCDGKFEVKHGPLSKELKAQMRSHLVPEGVCVLSKNQAREKRFPMVLFLDRITDTGNLGAIFRTAYFLGIDAIVLPEHGTAPLSAVTVKASAGALERVPILTVKDESAFVSESQKQGWKFYAADALEGKGAGSKAANDLQPEPVTTPFDMLRTHACVLMLGNEGTGLRPFLQRQADYHISIPSARRAGDDIDSLNVSVAAALLMSRFLSK